VTGSFSQLVSSTLLVVGALFPIVNPLGNAPIFLMLTSHADSPTRVAPSSHRPSP
jgi:small neutral amino acid transporter SnatA (MarC family)